MSVRGLHYGWVIVGAMFLIQTISSGFGFYNMAVYITELAKLLSVPVGSISLAVSLFFAVGGVTGIFIARIIDSYPIKRIMLLSTLGCGVCLALMSVVETLWQAYLVFGLFGVSNTGISLVVATTMVTRWFPGPNRSIALSVASTGLSMGGVVVTPLCAYLFNLYGLPVIMPWLGVFFVLVIVPVAIYLVRWPPDYAASQAVVVDKAKYREAVRSRFFVLLSVGYIFILGSQVGGIAHLYNHVQAVGNFTQAAIAMQILTICSISGRIFGGWVMTRIPVRWYALANLVLQALGLFVLSRATETSWALVGAGMFGLSVGNLLMSQPLWLAQVYSADIYPRVYALGNALTVVGVATGPSLLGALYDVSGYALAYLVAALGSTVALFVILLAGPGQGGTQEA